MIGEELHRPARASFGRLGARQGDDKRFLRAIELTLSARSDPVVEGSLKAALDTALAHGGDGGAMDMQCISDRLIGVITVGR